MNLQEAFDKIVTHARQQKVKSKVPDGDQCLYRGPNGAKCFVGALFPDGVGITEFQTIDEICNMVPALVGLEDCLYDLRNIHDNYEPAQWEEQFENFANGAGLTYEAPK